MKAIRMLLGITAMLLLTASSVAAQSPDATALGRLAVPIDTLTGAGSLSYPGELDWYTFEVTEPGTIHVLAVDTDGHESIRALLFDVDFDFIDHSEKGRIAATLEPGIYSIRVDSVDSSTTSYELSVSNGVEVESNDGLIEATALGAVDGLIRITGAIDPVGDADFYRFEIPEAGFTGGARALLLEVEGPALDDSLLVLYEYSEVEARYMPIMVDDDSGSGYWSRILLRAEPGARFAVRIEETGLPLVGISQYSLSVEPIALGTDQEPNNETSSAIALTLDPETSTWATDGVLDVDDPVDVFHLWNDEAGLLEIRTGAQIVSGEFDTVLALYDADGTLIAENDDSSGSLWSVLTVTLDPGDYYVEVRAATGTSLLPYRLSAARKQVRTLAEQEPNDMDSNAQPLDWHAGEVLMIEAEIGLGEDIDSFALSLDAETRLVVETGPGASMMSADTVLTIYDAELWEVAYNDDSQGSWSRIEETLGPGDYYIVVEGYYSDNAFDYALLISGY